MKNKLSQNIHIEIRKDRITKILTLMDKYLPIVVFSVLTSISIYTFLFYYKNGLGLSYNDARSHLDIGRRVVEGLKPGLAQLGSVWLPLPHLLMILTVWNNFMWHSGLSGTVESMFSFVATGVLIERFLKKLGSGLLGRIIGVAAFTVNLNILYMQSTSMTELLLIATMTWGCYELLLWFRNQKMLNLIYASFWIMLSTLIRYDGWFLLLMAAVLIASYSLKRHGYKVMEGTVLFFLTMGGLGIFLWFAWNQLIFKDALYFALGPYSAHAQQEQLSKAGDLITKGNILLSIKSYFYALAFNSNTFVLLLGIIGGFVFWFDKKIRGSVKLINLTLLAPLIFNILALYLGFSVLFIQGINGDTWFNVRYGIMMMPSIAIFVGFLVDRAKTLRILVVGLFLFVTFFSIANADAVTIDDARVGASQKNVKEVSGWLATHVKNEKGFVLIAAASHDAIIFSSGLSMSRFIHEGTGKYWESATTSPDRWARWIVMRTYDDSDQTYKLVSKTSAFRNGDYRLVGKYPFADIYELKTPFLKKLNTEPVIKNQR